MGKQGKGCGLSLFFSKDEMSAARRKARETAVGDRTDR
jgi:hypothetical protein